MKKYRTGDVLIRDDGGIRVITRETERSFYLAAIRDDNIVRAYIHNKIFVLTSKFYKKVEV